MKNISFRHDVLPLKNQLYRLALRITQNAEDSEDIVQEVMIKVWKRHDTLGDIDSLEAYCLKICRNQSLDYLRRKEMQNVPFDDGDTALEPADIFQRIQHRDNISIVRTLIDSLPEKQRTTIQLREFEGKSYKEISQILNISEEQVKISIFRARQTLKSKFDKLENYGL